MRKSEVGIMIWWWRPASPPNERKWVRQKEALNKEESSICLKWYKKGRKSNEWKSEEENNDVSQPVHKSQASLAQPLYVLSTQYPSNLGLSQLNIPNCEDQVKRITNSFHFLQICSSHKYLVRASSQCRRRAVNLVINRS